MGLFFEVIVVAVVTWLIARSAVAWRRERRLAQATTGMHDAGVWVNERAWMGIVSELEGDRHSARPPGSPVAERPEQAGQGQADRFGHDE